jgi:tetratricopeptide (TPR) repeat protein
MNIKNIKKSLVFAGFLWVAYLVSVTLSGCSAGGGQTTIMSITPEQYLASAKEQLEIIEERDYEVRDLEEVIRVLENAEKDAKRSDTMDRARMYLTLVNSMLARKKYKDLTVKADYVGSKPEPFYVINTKDIRETLRTANKWLRMCDAEFKTAALLPDLNFVRGYYYSQKMLTVHNRERKDYLDKAIGAYRRCLGLAPDYKSDFRIFTRYQTPREVRLRMAEALALGGQQADAHAIITEFTFSPIIPVPGANQHVDYVWHHTKGLVLATMGLYEEAAKTLEIFKIVTPIDYMQIDDALYILTGVYERLKEITKNQRFELEANFIAEMIKKLEGPYASENNVTSAHLFPIPMPGDQWFYRGVASFNQGDFATAAQIFGSLRSKGAMSKANRSAALLYQAEALLYDQQAVPDDLIESLVELVGQKDLTSLQRERLAYMLARYVMGADLEPNLSKTKHESHGYVRTIFTAPWAIEAKHKLGRVKRVAKPLKDRRSAEDGVAEDAERELSSIELEVYCNAPEDWVVSASMYVIALPELALLDQDKIVGKESGNTWEFKDEKLDQLKRKNNYLLVIEYDNSDSEKSIQGILIEAS